MKKGTLLVLLASFTILGVISFFFDKQIIIFITGLRVEGLNGFFKFLDLIGGTLGILIIISILALLKHRKSIIPLWLSLGLSALVVFFLKILVARVRPDVALIYEDGFSFPSGHANAVFSVLPVIWKKFGKIKYVWLIFAILIAFSRLYLGVHYLSDVIFGGLIGLSVGILVLFVLKKHFLKI